MRRRRSIPTRQIADNVFPDRFMSRLAAALAVLATLFAVVGIHGMLSYVIAQRTREIGLRHRARRAS
jgi:hypothetical protein